MLLSKKHKFMFIHIYKNAGTSITHALWPFALNSLKIETYLKLKGKGFPFLFFDPQPFPLHTTALEMSNSLGLDKFNSYYSFAVVRNPWDWQVSLYKYMLKNETHHQHELIESLGSFDEYIKWRCENDVHYQKDFIYSDSGKILVDFVGRYENLDSDFKTICSHIGVSAHLPKLNVSNTKPYQEYYTEETRELVKKTYEPDIQAFNYTF